jgi:hypothetical protein
MESSWDSVRKSTGVVMFGPVSLEMNTQYGRELALRRAAHGRLISQVWGTQPSTSDFTASAARSALRWHRRVTRFCHRHRSSRRRTAGFCHRIGTSPAASRIDTVTINTRKVRSRFSKHASHHSRRAIVQAQVEALAATTTESRRPLRASRLLARQGRGRAVAHPYGDYLAGRGKVAGGGRRP